MFQDQSRRKIQHLTTEQPKLPCRVLYPVVLASCQVLSSIFVSYIKKNKIAVLCCLREISGLQT